MQQETILITIWLIACIVLYRNFFIMWRGVVIMSTNNIIIKNAFISYPKSVKLWKCNVIRWVFCELRYVVTLFSMFSNLNCTELSQKRMNMSHHISEISTNIKIAKNKTKCESWINMLRNLCNVIHTELWRSIS